MRNWRSNWNIILQPNDKLLILCWICHKLVLRFFAVSIVFAFLCCNIELCYWNRPPKPKTITITTVTTCDLSLFHCMDLVFEFLIFCPFFVRGSSNWKWFALGSHGYWNKWFTIVESNERFYFVQVIACLLFFVISVFVCEIHCFSHIEYLYVIARVLRGHWTRIIVKVDWSFWSAMMDFSMNWYFFKIEVNFKRCKQLQRHLREFMKFTVFWLWKQAK